MKNQDESSPKDATSIAVEPIIVSPQDCTKRHQRMMFWLNQITASGIEGKFDWLDFNIDWNTIIVEDMICHSLISRAINNAEYNAIVALWNSRYGMLKGGDYVDDGSDDEVETFFGELPEELYSDE